METYGKGILKINDVRPGRMAFIVSPLIGRVGSVYGDGMIEWWILAGMF
ncbi:MAG: hypothetical protein PHV32_18635 [Eubacteriales bacterium]|nr:hypothetical protein [Eubacteriales bacterium]